MGIQFDTPDLQDELTKEAWNLAAEALREGKLTLSNKKVVTLDPKDLLRHVQWLAGLDKKKNKNLPKLKDVFIKTTE